MKPNQLFLFLGISIIIDTSLIIYSCQKDNSMKDNSKARTEMSLNDLQNEKNIIDFRDR